MGLQDYRKLETVSKYDVFKFIMEINNYRNNPFIAQDRKKDLRDLEKFLMGYLIQEIEINKFQIKDFLSLSIFFLYGVYAP